MHKGHNHRTEPASTPRANGNASSAPTGGRTTSTYTTQSQQPSSTAVDNDEDNRGPAARSDEAWTGYHPSAGSDFRDSGLGEGFGDSLNNGDGQDGNPGAMRRAIGGGTITTNGVEEVVTVTTLPEKEGVFLFQHRNYQVMSPRRNSKVVRRYSDFVWLLDCLHKRYPFRQLPLLPPKRVASKHALFPSGMLRRCTNYSVNGNHLAADNHFLEKRRRGLARFVNALVRHPVLSQEQLVIMFLTVPTVEVCL